MRDIIYPPIVVTCKAAFRVLGQKFDMRGTEHIPRTGGALVAVNHTGYIDFIYAGLAAQPSKRKIRFMGKKELFDHKFTGPIMRGCHHIEVDRAAGESSVHTAIDYLKAGEIVGIYPEATISRAFELKSFKTGAVRIAAEAGVPIIPVIVWGPHRMFTKDHPRDLSRGKSIAIRVGAPLHPTGDDPAGETQELFDSMSGLLDETIRAYPESEQPPGSWWLPAKYGGSAPTLEVAAELDIEEKKARAARKAAREAEGK